MYKFCVCFQENIDEEIKEQLLSKTTKPDNHEIEEEMITEGETKMQIEEVLTQDDDTNPELTKVSFLFLIVIIILTILILTVHDIPDLEYFTRTIKWNSWKQKLENITNKEAAYSELTNVSFFS